MISRLVHLITSSQSPNSKLAFMHPKGISNLTGLTVNFWWPLPSDPPLALAQYMAPYNCLGLPFLTRPIHQQRLSAPSSKYTPNPTTFHQAPTTEISLLFVKHTQHIPNFTVFVPLPDPSDPSSPRSLHGSLPHFFQPLATCLEGLPWQLLG